MGVPGGSGVLSQRVGGLMMMRVASVALPVVAAAIFGVISWQSEVSSARSNSLQHARLIAQHVESVIRTQTALHRAAAVRIAAEPPGFVASRAMHEFLRELTVSAPRGLMVLSPAGEMRASSLVFPVNGTMERDYLRILSEGAEIAIDRYPLQPGGADGFVVASRVAGPDGPLVIVSAIEAAGVAGFLRGIVTHEGESASLLRRDGKLLLRNFPSPAIMLPPDAEGVRAMQVSDEALYTTVARSDGIERVYALVRAGNLDLFGGFGVPTQVIWSGWLRQVMPVFGLFAIVALATVMLTEFLRRWLAQRYVVERARADMAAAERLADTRTAMLREMNHRIKNNLALIVSLIHLRRRQGTLDPEELAARVGAIGRVHDMMYQSDDGARMDFSALVRELCGNAALIPAEAGITVTCDVAPGIELSPDQSTPLALILVEVLTNAIKHAFVGRGADDNRVHVSFERQGDEVVLTIRDNGRGLPEDAERRSGTAIIAALAGQIGARITQHSDGGAVTVLRLPIHDPA